LISIALCLGLTACSTTGIQEKSVENSPLKAPAKMDVVKPIVDVKPISKDKMTPIEVKKQPIKQNVIDVEVTPKPKRLPTRTAKGKLILGEEEWVYFPGLDKSFRAKVDSDVTTSSISAVDVVPFEREGKEWVKFRVEYAKISSNEISLPILRWAKIKRGNHVESQKRPVITAWIQVGDVKDKADFTLTNSKDLSSPVILGQNFFRDIAVIDVSRQHVQPKKR